MPRPPRSQTCLDGVVQHIVNRGNLRAKIFREDADYLGFIGAMAEAGEHAVIHVMAFCLMPNHWHLVLLPPRGREISAYMQHLMNSHIRDLQRRHNLAGTGHVYQGRYRNHPVHAQHHFLNVCRYVEANARTAGLVQQAEHWPWSSLARRGPTDDIDLLSEWPVRKPANWLELVNQPQSTVPVVSRRRRQKGAGTLVEKVSAPFDPVLRAGRPLTTVDQRVRRDENER